MTKEIRNTTVAANSSAIQLRATNDGNRVKGTAIVFNSLSQDLGNFREIIAPSAINLQRDNDCLALYNHDTGRVLGRTTSGTLSLNLTPRGLDFTLDLPKSAADVREALQRGDVHGCSFGFIMNSDDWTSDSTRGIIRTVTDLTLIEITLTCSPAYPQTDAAIRRAPADIRAMLKRDDITDDDADCDCDCEACLDDRCLDCSDPECTDEDCTRCGMQSRSAVIACILRRRRY